MRTLIIDNYDSFTYNLYQMIAEVNGVSPLVICNDQADWNSLKQLVFDNIVISPGPGRPEVSEDFGICSEIILKAEVPLLGVCLGHQGLGYQYGATVTYAPEVRHGRSSLIYHNGVGIFKGIPNPFYAVRYHSLVVENELPTCLEKVAWTDDGLLMGLRHQQLPQWGVQFHPESICTEYGRTLLENFRDLSRKSADEKRRDFFESRTATTEQLPTDVKNHCSAPLPEFEVYSRKLIAYFDTERIFVQLFGTASTAFWLDSSLIKPGLSRFSFLGDSTSASSLLIRYYSQSQQLIITQAGQMSCRAESIFEFLKREIENRHCQSDDLPFNFNCGFVGYFGYELKAECGADAAHSSTIPDAVFLFAERLIAVDHQEQKIYLVHLIPKGQPEQAEAWFNLIQQQLEALEPTPPITAECEYEPPLCFRLSRSYEAYIDDIDQCLREIHDGETYQVCLTNRLHTNYNPDPLTLYRNLRRVNPAPYAALLRFDEIAIVCSSPERFLSIDRFGWVETRPIKGTVRRSQQIEDDLSLSEQLRQSEKDRAENLMIVDLMRNDLGRVCEVGSVHVPRLMDVETYATVHHLVTTIRGHLRPDKDVIDCVLNAFPGGSMTGAPKLRTLQIIDRLEQEARGAYSGAIGFLGLNGAADLNIVIRTAVLTPKGTTIGIGGGIVALSNPRLEFEETLLKAQALIQALVITAYGTFNRTLYSIDGVPVGEKSVVDDRLQ